MERLTKNGKRTSYRPDYPYFTTTDCIRKLGKLEDIEQELGIELTTLFNLKTIYVKDGYTHTKEETHIIGIDIFNKVIRATGQNGTYKDILITDYGKTWALTKEELSHS